ncbi:MAG: hypothetical protein M1514_03370 [Patescibacteria group bacterium]|nr:hypothetical protein [Patescibacteria group bacterium]
MIDWVKKLFKSSFTSFGPLNPADQGAIKKVLVTRSNYDSTTAYLFAWVEPVVDFLKSSAGFSLTALEQEQACKKDFLNCLKDNHPDFIFLNGHGSTTTVTGYNSEILLSLGNDEDLLKGKIIYAIACRSARTLGNWLADNGTKAYLGYDDDFIFLVDTNKSEKPLTDDTAQLYLEPATLVAKSLLEGKTAGEAWQISQDKFQENINAMLTSESTEDDRDLLPYLYWDREHQVCLGEKEAKI